MSYANELLVECKAIIALKGGKQINDSLKLISEEIIEATNWLPAKTNLKKRAQAIVNGFTMKCLCCGADTPHLDMHYCSLECYQCHSPEYASLDTPEVVAKIERATMVAEQRFADATLGYDYIECAVCDCKGADLSVHIRMHGLTPTEYKLFFGVKSIKCQKMCDSVKGSKNPGYQHGGIYSPFSEKFVAGYDKEWHEDRKVELKALMDATKDTNPVCIEYWLVQTGGDKILAKKLLGDYQRRGLEFFVNKYGEEEGTRRYHEKTNNWMATMASKSEEEMNDINERKGITWSRVEDEIRDFIGQSVSGLTKQLRIWHNTGGKDGYYCDYDIAYGDRIIEVHGDYWHANPNIYNETFINKHNGKTFADIHYRNDFKRKIAEDRGYELLEIWESDYHTDMQGVIDECIRFLTK